MSERVATSVWDIIFADPTEAKLMRMRSTLLSDVRLVLDARGVTVDEAAKFLDLSQPRVSDFLRGKLSKFNLETLISLSERCGRTVELVRGAA